MNMDDDYEKEMEKERNMEGLSPNEKYQLENNAKI